METGELSTTATIESSVVHAQLSIKEVTFSGNHEIDRDTAGDCPPPDWASNRNTQWPVCYTRARNVRLKARFDVIAPPTATESVRIRGIATLDNTAMEWTGSVSVSPGSTEVTTGELTSSAPLPNCVGYYSPATIQWEAEPPGAPAYVAAGASANVVYVTLGDPSGTPAYWTLLEISCKAAHGATSASQLIREAYVPFMSRTLTRMRDGRLLTYWEPKDTNATCTADLLQMGHGGGQCGSWAEFLIDMYKCHGEKGRKIEVVVTLAYARARSVGFLVKHWMFWGNGSYAPPFTHLEGTECLSFPVAGQGNDDPWPNFTNHFIVRADGLFLDPSYGSPPFFTELEWENASIDGLDWNWRGGFRKDEYLTVRLLQFH
jgi:hypothetical protein